MWLRWPEHLNPLLSLSDTAVAVGCLASEDALTHKCSSSMEGIDGLNHPPRSWNTGSSI